MFKFNTTRVLGTLLVGLLAAGPAFSKGRDRTAGRAKSEIAQERSRSERAPAQADQAPARTVDVHTLVEKPKAPRQVERIAEERMPSATMKRPTGRDQVGLAGDLAAKTALSQQVRDLARERRESLAQLDRVPMGNPYANNRKPHTGTGPGHAPGTGIGSSRTGNLTIHYEPGTGGIPGGGKPFSNGVSERSDVGDTMWKGGTAVVATGTATTVGGTMGALPVTAIVGGGGAGAAAIGTAATGVGAAAIVGLAVGSALDWAIEKATGDSIGGHLADATDDTPSDAETAAAAKKAFEEGRKKKAEREKQQQEEAQRQADEEAKKKEEEEAKKQEEAQKKKDEEEKKNGSSDSTPNPMDDSFGQQGELPSYHPMQDSNKLYGPGEGEIVLTEEQVAELMAHAQAEANSRLQSLINPGDDVQGAPTGETPDFDECVVDGGHCEPESVTGQ